MKTFFKYLGAALLILTALVLFLADMGRDMKAAKEAEQQRLAQICEIIEPSPDMLKALNGAWEEWPGTGLVAWTVHRSEKWLDRLYYIADIQGEGLEEYGDKVVWLVRGDTGPVYSMTHPTASGSIFPYGPDLGDGEFSPYNDPAYKDALACDKYINIKKYGAKSDGE